MCQLAHGYIRSPAELNELYERDVDELYERDLDDLDERDIDELYVRDLDELAFGSTMYARNAGDLLYARLVDDIASLASAGSKRYAPELYARAGSRSGSPSGSRTGSPSGGSRGGSRAGSPGGDHQSDDESSFDGSEGSTDTARQVGMSKLKTTREKKIRILGVRNNRWNTEF